MVPLVLWKSVLFLTFEQFNNSEGNISFYEVDVYPIHNKTLIYDNFIKSLTNCIYVHAWQNTRSMCHLKLNIYLLILLPVTCHLLVIELNIKERECVTIKQNWKLLFHILSELKCSLVEIPALGQLFLNWQQKHRYNGIQNCFIANVFFGHHNFVLYFCKYIVQREKIHLSFQRRDVNTFIAACFKLTKKYSAIVTLYL